MRSLPTVLFALCWLWTASGEPIFLYPTNTNHDSYMELDAKQMSLVLAHHLRLDAVAETQPNVVLGENDRVFETYLAQVAHNGEDFVGRGMESAMIVNVESSSTDFLPEELRRNTIELFVPEGEDDSFSFTPTIATYLHQAGRVYHTVSSSLLPPPTLLDINIFSVSTSENVHQFLGDLTSFVNYVEKQPSTEPQFGGFSIRGLSGIVEEFGVQSEQYSTAVEVLRATLMKAMSEKIRMAVLLSPPSGGSYMTKRQVQPPQSPLPPGQNSSIPPQEPYFSTSTCYTTMDTCTNSTNSCSGHGSCTNATRTIKGEQKTCFVCACQASVSDRGSKTVWVGTACEKKDVSGPFVLLAGTTIGVIAIIIGSISLLTSMGSEQLPGVLTAGATGGITHLKRS